VRAQQWPQPTMPALFISVRGARLGAGTVHDNFPALVRAAGLQAVGPRRPRPHDLRHSFAVTSVLGWYRDDADVQANLPALSTWLGHVHPADTYWYLQAAPELLALAAQRLEIRGSR
jgi:integrase/recombinase XerD